MKTGKERVPGFCFARGRSIRPFAGGSFVELKGRSAMERSFFSQGGRFLLGNKASGDGSRAVSFGHEEDAGMGRKAGFAALVLLWLGSVAFGQGLYFDLGVGYGKGRTVHEGVNLANRFPFSNGSVEERAGDASVKAGFGPIGYLPAYVVAEWGWLWHRVYDAVLSARIDSYLAGVGVVVYPVRLVQFGCTIGYSYRKCETNASAYAIDVGNGGLGWNVSAALDLGKRNNGILAGVKYQRSERKVLMFDSLMESSGLLFFVKYAFRQKF